MKRGELPLYVAEGLTSFAANWLNTGVYFVTTRVLGWSAGQSLALLAAQGVMGIGGSLLASRLSRRFGGRQLLVPIYFGLAVLAGTMALVGGWGLVGLLLAWMFTCALNWPAIEALLCHAGDAREVSRRVGWYNVVWAATGALAIASQGAVIERRPMGIFVGAAGLHLVSAILVMLSRGGEEKRSAHLEAPPELLAKRAYAKRLCRLALPASYVVINSLVALLAGLPAVRELGPTMTGVAISVWLVARIAAFAAMGMTSFWHVRPGLVMVAVVTMALGFGGLMWGGTMVGSGLAWIVAMELVLGASVGVIYFGSLYFGLVLSHGGEGEGGATEQSGFHEAVIGLGTVLGPGAGAAATMMGGSPSWGVGAIVAGSVALCAGASLRGEGNAGSPRV